MNVRQSRLLHKLQIFVISRHSPEKNELFMRNKERGTGLFAFGVNVIISLVLWSCFMADHVMQVTKLFNRCLCVIEGVSSSLIMERFS